MKPSHAVRGRTQAFVGYKRVGPEGSLIRAAVSNELALERRGEGVGGARQ